jgi:proteasome alpha subunit
LPSYSPYDWNESIQQRNEFIEDRLKDGSPVVALTYDAGVLLVSVRQTQRKVYEIYDRLMFSAIGNHSDIEQIRSAAIDVAHSEGFSRSPDDVSIQRMVSFRISPAIKKVYSDPFAQPIVFRGIFVELGKKAERDQIVTLSYDGEFSSSLGHAVVAGSAYAEDRMREHLTTETSGGVPTLAQALTAGVYAWGVGAKHLDAEDRADADYSTEGEGKSDVSAFIKEKLAKGWVLEAGVLERNTTRESKFRLLTEAELAETLTAYRTE